MTNSELFTAAHKLAKTFEGDYSACFSLALSEVYASLKKEQFSSSCAITGLGFNAKSKRQKNHPEISAFFNDLHKYEGSMYRTIKDAVLAKKGTFNTIDKVLEFAKTVKATPEIEEHVEYISCLELI